MGGNWHELWCLGSILNPFFYKVKLVNHVGQQTYPGQGIYGVENKCAEAKHHASLGKCWRETTIVPWLDFCPVLSSYVCVVSCERWEVGGCS